VQWRHAAKKDNDIKLTLVSGLFVAAYALGQTAPAEGMKERNNLRNTRYCEVLLVTRHGLSATAAAYNVGFLRRAANYF
jgi:hypothetical protein